MVLNCGIGEDSWESLGLQGDQSILKEISLEYSLEELMLAETLILWPPDVKNWLIGKDPDEGKDWRKEENRTTVDEMVGWHHQLDEHEFKQDLEIGDGQGSLVSSSPWDLRVRHDWATELNWIEYKKNFFSLRFSVYNISNHCFKNKRTKSILCNLKGTNASFHLY